MYKLCLSFLFLSLQESPTKKGKYNGWTVFVFSESGLNVLYSPDSVGVTKGDLCLSLERNILSEMMKTKTLAGLVSFLVLFPPCFISSGNSWNRLSASHSPLQPTYPGPMASSIKNPSNVICDDISQKLSSDLMPKFIRVRV